MGKKRGGRLHIITRPAIMGTTAQQVRVAPSPVEMGEMELAQEPRSFGDPKGPPPGPSVQCAYEIATRCARLETDYAWLPDLDLGPLDATVHPSTDTHTQKTFFSAPTLGTAMGLLGVCWWSYLLAGVQVIGG